MHMNRKKEKELATQAVIKTLEMAVKRRLNATLTPSDCVIILNEIRSVRNNIFSSVGHDITDAVMDIFIPDTQRRRR